MALRALRPRSPGCNAGREYSSPQKRQWLEILPWFWLEAPDLLLLDEPTAGMAPEETGNTAAVLRDLNRTGLTILVVEHDMAFGAQRSPGG